MAATPPGMTSEVVEEWYSAMRECYEDSAIEVSGEVLASLTDLLSLCRRATAEGGQVFYWWHL